MTSITQPVVSAKQRPPRARTGWFLLLGIALGAGLGGGGAWLYFSQPVLPRVGAQAPSKPVFYQCPMHPAVTSDHPGDCPICGMKLVEAKADEPGTDTAAKPGERRIAFYRSPMNPSQTSPEPRKDEMGMDYLPVYDDELAAGHGATPAGRATVTIDSARQQLIGLRTAAVSQTAAGGSMRTVGRVEIDPTRVRKTNVKSEGYIEKLFVDFVGRPVALGEPLFTLFSPSLLAAENEYLIALRVRDDLSKSEQPDQDGETLVALARQKLELLDVPADELARLEKSRTASKSLTFLSPVAGVVTAKNVVEGARVSPGDAPFEITDLGVVWVIADAYEADLARVQVGMSAAFTVQAYPGRSFDGTVQFISPVMEAKTRTAKLRLVFQNASGDLKPEMFGEVVLKGEDRNVLRLPADAVIRAGGKDVVFVARGGGKFEPREVQLGPKAGDTFEVVGGVEAGEQVVTRANFLVDSESQLRASLAAMGGK
jgi:Cu(I)/Ag(I) efflux system membrane fusion protein